MYSKITVDLKNSVGSPAEQFFQFLKYSIVVGRADFEVASPTIFH